MKGLTVWTYRTPGRDCTNNGITAQNDQFTLTGPDIEGPFEPNADAPELRLVKRYGVGRESHYWTAYPLDEDGKVCRDGMFGGNYVKTSDSRFPSDYPIPVHDRFE